MKTEAQVRNAIKRLLAQRRRNTDNWGVWDERLLTNIDQEITLKWVLGKLTYDLVTGKEPKK